jgi:hypothetical protein
MIRGDTAVFPFPYTGAAPVALRFYVRKQVDGQVLVALTLAAQPSRFTVAEDAIAVALLPADTEGQPACGYQAWVYDLEVTDTDGVVTTVWGGPFELVGDVAAGDVVDPAVIAPLLGVTVAERAGLDAAAAPGTLNPLITASALAAELADYAPDDHTHGGGDVTSAVASATDADTVDGEHASAFADASHTHGGGDVTSAVASATDADTVDGAHASAFADASHTHGGGDVTSAVANATDADTVDGAHASAFADASHTHGGGDVTSAVASATDADTVDGAHASAFADASHSHAGAGSADREFCFVAEFAGAVLAADGGDNVGTLTAAHDATDHRNYYDWTTAEASTQDYDLVLQWRLPPEFSGWRAGDANVYVTSRVSATPGATGVRVVEFLDAGGTNRITAATKQNAAWTADAFAISGGTWAAGDLVTLRVRLLADAGKAAQLHGVRLPWTAV